MKIKTAVVIGVGTFYGMFMFLAVLAVTGILEDAIQGQPMDDFRPLAFVGLGALSVGTAALILALVPRGRATPVAALTLAAAYGLLYLTDQHLLPAVTTGAPAGRTDVVLTGSFVTLAHASVLLVEYFRTKLALLRDDGSERRSWWH